MVKVSFNKALAQKDPKKDSETLLSSVQDLEGAVFVRQQSKVWCWCFCLGLGLVLSGVLVGGAYLYRYYVQEKCMQVWNNLRGRGYLETIPVSWAADRDELKGAFFCGVGYYEENSDVTDDMYVDLPLRYIEENVSFLENDEVEFIRVPVPEFRESDAADIVHDFKMRLTAYLDLDLDKCYIITLNMSIVLPPKDFQDFLKNINAGTYLPQSYLVHEEMMITEKLESTSELGLSINKLCKDKDVYRLQRRDTILGMQKREALNCRKIRHFENKFVVETMICEP